MPKSKILIVDDQQRNLIALQAVLDDIGSDVDEALSGFKAVELCTAKDYAVIILDVMMPGMDGLETANRIRKLPQHHATPIIFLTAGDDPRLESEGYKAGGYDFLFKPIDADILKAKVLGFLKLFEEKTDLKSKLTSMQAACHDLEAEIVAQKKRLQALLEEMQKVSAKPED